MKARHCIRKEYQPSIFYCTQNVQWIKNKKEDEIYKVLSIFDSGIIICTGFFSENAGNCPYVESISWGELKINKWQWSSNNKIWRNFK